MTIQNLFARAFLAIAGIFALLSLVSVIGTLLFLSNSDIVEGRVIGYREIRNYAPFGLFRPEDAARYFLEAEYRARATRGVGARTSVAAALHTVTATRGSSERKYEIGASIGVRHHNRAPQRARINTLAGLWGAGGVFGVLTVVFGLLGWLARFAFRLGNQNGSSTT